MAQSTKAGGPSALQATGHLSVRGDGPASHDLNFLVGQQSKRLGPALAVSTAINVAGIVLLILASRWAISPKPTGAFIPDLESPSLVYLNIPGPGGGGGGGGNKSIEPPKLAELPGKDKITVPVVKPPAPEPPKPRETPREPDPPLQEVNIPAKMLEASNDTLPGALEAPSVPTTTSLGSGSGSGAGTGQGSGIGQGTGSGLGAGMGGGTGGGLYRVGNGVTSPRILQQVRPNYTPDAMRAKVQGVVVLLCTVRTDGTASDIRITRSLDPVFGLDEEAIRTLRRWRFAPGMLAGQPVNVEVQIEMSFTLR